MQDDSIASDRGGAQDQHGQDDRQRVLRAQQEAQERERTERDEADERGRHRIPAACPPAGHALPSSNPRAATAPGAQQGSRGRVFVLGVAVVAALAFAGYKYTRGASTHHAAAAGPESPLTAGLPPVADEAPRVEPAGPALPSEPAAAAQPAPAEGGNLLGEASPADRPQGTGAEAEPTTRSAGQSPETPDADARLQQRLQTVEALVQELREQLVRLEGQQSALAATAAKLTTQHAAPRARPAPRPVASAPPAPEPATPRLAGRLLAVDSWGGVPSVIVGTGMPGDKRTRVMRPGDAYNGISLLEASRARGEATFVADGKPFRMTLQDGE